MRWDSGAGTPHAASMIAQVELVAWDQGGAAEHKGPGDLKLSMARQELALCCHYAPTAGETPHRRCLVYPLRRPCSLEELGWMDTEPAFCLFQNVTSVSVYEIQDKGVKTCRTVSFAFHSPLPLLTYFSSATASHTHACRWNVCTSVTVSSKIL